MLYLCVLQMPSVETDMLISFNNPVTDLSQVGVLDHTTLNTFKTFLQTFQMKDWSLFG